LLRNYPPKRGFVISSFLPEVLVALRENDQRVPLGVICETRDELHRWRELPVEYVIPNHKLATESLIRELKKQRKKILIWTVNRRVQMDRFRNLGVDGIISDDTKLLRRSMQA
jgi:glycerophosphoryl diester phosphodiesterase